jgi:hypothetical protein
VSVTASLEQIVKRTKRIFLLFAQIDRRLDLDLAVQIADVPGTHIFDAFSAKSKNPFGLAFSRDLKLRTAIQGWDLDLTAESRHCNADWHLAIETVAIPRKNGVLAGSNLYIKIASRTAGAALTLARQSNLIAIINAGRHLDLKGLGFL